MPYRLVSFGVWVQVWYQAGYVKLSSAHLCEGEQIIWHQNIIFVTASWIIPLTGDGVFSSGAGSWLFPKGPFRLERLSALGAVPSLDTECGCSLKSTFLDSFDEVFLGILSSTWECDGGTGEGDAEEHATERDERDRPNPPINFIPEEVPLVGKVTGVACVSSALRRGEGAVNETSPALDAVLVAVASPLEVSTGFDGVLSELLISAN